MGTQVLQSSVQAGAAVAQYAIGAKVEYFSEARGGWLPAVVQGYNAGTGAYVLDVHPAALPSKIRSVGAGSASITAVGQTTVSVQAPSVFDMIDKNHDGVITRSEFNAAVKS